MLVLSRRERERVSGDKVRLGIEAPADVLVLRDELDVQVPPTAELEIEVDTCSDAVTPSSQAADVTSELVSIAK